MIRRYVRPVLQQRPEGGRTASLLGSVGAVVEHLESWSWAGGERGVLLASSWGPGAWWAAGLAQRLAEENFSIQLVAALGGGSGLWERWLQAAGEAAALLHSTCDVVSAAGAGFGAPLLAALAGRCDDLACIALFEPEPLAGGSVQRHCGPDAAFAAESSEELAWWAEALPEALRAIATGRQGEADEALASLERGASGVAPLPAACPVLCQASEGSEPAWLGAGAELVAYDPGGGEQEAESILAGALGFVRSHSNAALR